MATLDIGCIIDPQKSRLLQEFPNFLACIFPRLVQGLYVPGIPELVDEQSILGIELCLELIPPVILLGEYCWPLGLDIQNHCCNMMILYDAI